MSPTSRPQPPRRRKRAASAAPLKSAEPAAVSTFLAEFPPDIAALALEVRALVLAAIPTAIERVLPGWRALNYRDAHAGHLAALFPHEKSVRLYLEHGARLASGGRDAAGLLQGEGTMRRGRYILFEPGHPLSARRKHAVRTLLVEAIRTASL